MPWSSRRRSWTPWWTWPASWSRVGSPSKTQWESLDIVLHFHVGLIRGIIPDLPQQSDVIPSNQWWTGWKSLLIFFMIFVKSVIPIFEKLFEHFTFSWLFEFEAVCLFLTFPKSLEWNMIKIIFKKSTTLETLSMRRTLLTAIMNKYLCIWSFCKSVLISTKTETVSIFLMASWYNSSLLLIILSKINKGYKKNSGNRNIHFW